MDIMKIDKKELLYMMFFVRFVGTRKTIKEGACL